MSVALARERRSRKNIPPEDYLTGPDGIKYYDLVQGTGPVAAIGTTVQVHFDCVYRGVTAISTRESKLLAGNRSISQPYVFKVGSPPGKERKRDFVDNPNGLFSAQAAPKPPPAMYKMTEGMRVGGKRTVIVSPEVGYGQKGMNEIPPGATFDLNIELLQVEAPENKTWNAAIQKREIILYISFFKSEGSFLLGKPSLSGKFPCRETFLNKEMQTAEILFKEKISEQDTCKPKNNKLI
ncbi:uncharacterized protein [Phyllobates terribilis]|uniref:uncharacterized protein n=1 Tax=Phyllobates terribilis TaxID=111132 RepID=UPI003CCAF6F5